MHTKPGSASWSPTSSAGTPATRRSNSCAGVSVLPADRGGVLPDGTSLVHITNDPDEAARAPIGEAVVADLRTAAEALLAHVDETSRTAPTARDPITDPGSQTAPLAPGALWSTVGLNLPADTLLVTEAGSNEFPIGTCIRPGHLFSHLSAAGGGLGFGLPAAVGAQLAAPDRPVVAAMGDGSMHYAITSLWTAAHYGIPLTIVVASNSEYGILKEFGVIEHATGVPGLDLPGLDIVATARSYGVDAHEAKAPTRSPNCSTMTSPTGTDQRSSTSAPHPSAPIRSARAREASDEISRRLPRPDHAHHRRQLRNRCAIRPAPRDPRIRPRSCRAPTGSAGVAGE